MLEHRLAIVTAAAAFCLLVVGGTVNPTGSSLACPEAFVVCHGSLLPEMKGGVLFEHGHRLVAMAVGFLQIGLTVALLARRRRELGGLAIVTLVAVLVQGLLGALTVKYKLPWFVSTAHLTLAFLYLAALIFLAWRTRPDAPAALDRGSIDIGRARRAVAIAGVLVLGQIVLGGLVRHSGGALASIDWPLHQGSLWPGGPLVLQLHMAHRIGGVVVGVVAIACAVVVYRAARGHRRLRAMAAAVPFVIAGQIALGLWIIASFRQVPVVVAHFAGAATLWSLWVGMWWMTAARGPAERTIAARPTDRADAPASPRAAGVWQSDSVGAPASAARPGATS
jgi:heme a synthase